MSERQLNVVDVQCFAGAFTLGAVKAGFKLIQKYENAAGFGVANCEANRHLLGYDWVTQQVEPDSWTSNPAWNVDLLISNPPCSAFSAQTEQRYRGSDSEINQCMWDTFNLAVDLDPTVLIMESVQPALTGGLGLMRDLWDFLEEQTGSKYHCTHVLQNNLSVGGCSDRRRYFLVLSKVPFGVEVPLLESLPTMEDAIGDLENLRANWMDQPYAPNPTPSAWVYGRQMRRADDMVDGHSYRTTKGLERNLQVIRSAYISGGENVQDAIVRCYARDGKLPSLWQERASDGRTYEEKALEKYYDKGQDSWTFRKLQPVGKWYYDQPARVIDGEGTYRTVHPTKDRYLTHRECARIMGFPDDWRIVPYGWEPVTNKTWGKGVSVEVAQWISHWAKESIQGRPGAETGVLLENLPRTRSKGFVSRDHELVIDCSRPRVVR